MASSTSETSLSKRSGTAWTAPNAAAESESPNTTENSAKMLFRVDGAHSPSTAPHTPVDRPIRSPRSPLSTPAPKPLSAPDSENSSRNRSGTTDQNANSAASPDTKAQHASSHQRLSSPKQEETLQPECISSTTNEFSWQTLHAENIAEILEKRLYEVERREHLLNRRAAQLAMEERKFRLWAHEEKMLLRQQQREYAIRQEELNRRSADLRWLLMMEDAPQGEPGNDLIHENSQAKFTDSTNSLQVDASSEFFENFCENFEELFQEDSNGIRRLKNS